MSRLSLVSEFDDLVRSRAVLTAGIETGSQFTLVPYTSLFVCMWVE